MSDAKGPFVVLGENGPVEKVHTPENGYDPPPELVQCQGCGAIRGSASIGMSHACHRNADGTYEEGGTFQ